MRKSKVLIFLTWLGFGLTTASSYGALFVYSFTDGPTTVTGTLEGTQNGNFVDHVSGVTMSINGSAVVGPIFTASWSGPPAYQWLSGPVVSTLVSQCNFVFADSDLVTSQNSYHDDFWLVNPNLSPLTEAYTFLNGQQWYTLNGTVPQAAWSLTPFSSVPESATVLPGLLALMITLPFLRRTFGRQPG